VFLVPLYFLARFAPQHLAAFRAQEMRALERRRQRLLRRSTRGDPFREAVRRLRLAQVDGGRRCLAELDDLFNQHISKEEGCEHWE
jgi:hypothetical protein